MKHKKVEIPTRPDWWTINMPQEHTVQIGWHNQGNDWWNNTCADVLEV